MKKIFYLFLALTCSTQSSMGWAPSITFNHLLSWGKSQVCHLIDLAKEHPQFSISLGAAATFMGLRYLYRKVFIDEYQIGVVKVELLKGSICKIEKPNIATFYRHHIIGTKYLNPATQEIVIKNRTGYFAFIASKAVSKPFVQIVYNTHDRHASGYDNTVAYDARNNTYTFECDGALDSRVDYIVYVPWNMKDIRYSISH